MRSVDSLVTADRRHVWHPYAAPGGGPYPVVRAAHGTRLLLEDEAGTHEVVDAMASWWCAVHGYRHPALDEAVRRQVDGFSHVMFGGLTHEPAIALSELLVELAPPGLTRVFLADSGSVAMEVALKVARQAASSRAGRPPTRFAALRGGYHGDTWGAMSVCDPDGGMHQLWAGQLPEQLFLPRPPARGCAPVVLEAWCRATADLVEQHAADLVGIVCEPLLQGAGGMWSYDVAALRHLRALADRYRLLLVVDEIATGFGRTGTLWACDAAGVVPDVMAVGKALTGGYATQAAVLLTDDVAEQVGRSAQGALMHGPTFMANPLVSAISLASVGEIARGGWRQDVPRIERGLRAGLEPLRERAGVADVRVLGATGAVQLRRDVDVPLATRVALAAGVWLRPFRDLVYAMPPYVATDADIAQVCAAIAAVVAAHEQE